MGLNRGASHDSHTRLIQASNNTFRRSRSPRRNMDRSPPRYHCSSRNIHLDTSIEKHFFNKVRLTVYLWLSKAVQSSGWKVCRVPETPLHRLVQGSGYGRWSDWGLVAHWGGECDKTQIGNCFIVLHFLKTSGIISSWWSLLGMFRKS